MVQRKRRRRKKKRRRKIREENIKTIVVKILKEVVKTISELKKERLKNLLIVRSYHQNMRITNGK